MGRLVDRSSCSGATNRSSGVRGGDRPGGSSGRGAGSTSQDGAHGDAATQGRGGWGDGAKGGGVDGDNHRDGIRGGGGVVGIALVGGDCRVGAGGGIGNGAGVGDGGATGGSSASSCWIAASAHAATGDRPVHSIICREICWGSSPGGAADYCGKGDGGARRCSAARGEKNCWGGLSNDDRGGRARGDGVVVAICSRAIEGSDRGVGAGR